MLTNNSIRRFIPLLIKAKECSEGQPALVRRAINEQICLLLPNISLHFIKYLFSGRLLTNYLVEYFSMRRFIPLLVKLKSAAKGNDALVRTALNEQICLLFAKYFFKFH